MLEKRVIYGIPGMEDVIRRSVIYNSEHDMPLTLDLYSPPEILPDAQLPVVLFVFGYSDSVALERFGLKPKDAGQYISWGQLVAASGMIAITYETIQPERDVLSVLTYIRENAEALRVDGHRIGIWACSGNVPTALFTLVHASADLRCAALYYGMMFDREGSKEMEEGAKRHGAAYPCRAESVAHFSADLPLFVVRAGQDQLALNQSIDDFVSEATRRNLPLTFVNHADGQHAFDIQDDTAASREIIRQTLAFFHEHLLKSV